MNQPEKDAMAALKPGDFVYRKNFNEWHKAEVTRITSTQVLLGAEQRYRKDSGNRIGGGGWSRYRDYIVPITIATTAEFMRAASEIEMQRRINVARQRIALLLVSEATIDFIEAMLGAADKNESIFDAARAFLKS